MWISLFLFILLICTLMLRHSYKKHINTQVYSFLEYREFISNHIGFDRLDYDIEFAYNVKTDRIEIINQDSYQISDTVLFIHETMHIPYYLNSHKKEAHLFFKRFFLYLIPFFFITLVATVSFKLDMRYLYFLLFSIFLTQTFMIIEILYADMIAARKRIAFFSDKLYSKFIITTYIIGVYQTLFIHLLLALLFYSFTFMFIT